jgi:hypothetical protein
MSKAYGLTVKKPEKKTEQKDLEGKPAKMIPKKICPLLMSECLGDSCAMFADKYNVCGVHIIVGELIEIAKKLGVNIYVDE